MTLALILLVAASTDTFTGKVTVITDGDSIKVLNGRTEVTIRLEGIDCPEAKQAFGQQAKKQTSELCFGKTVTVQPKGKDGYGRTLADVILPDGKSLNHELVRSGSAWWFRSSLVGVIVSVQLLRNSTAVTPFT
jgi:micrococcal nuclease